MSRRRGGTVEGRSEGPVHAYCEVIARRREGAYWVLSMAAREIAERAQPGQFVQIAVEGQHTLLRRPFSIARVTRQGASAGTVDVVFDAHGPGTSWLTGVETHDVIDVIGPLGTPFPLPQRKVNCLLVGGGYGIAPLYYLAESLLRRGLRVDMINGAATAERIMGAIEAKRLSASVTFTTEDGTYGSRGRVTDVLDEVVETGHTGLVYACGPNPMLRAVSERCVELGIPVQVAVEERMGCGIGVCYTCVVPIVGRDGATRHKRACVEGPVFNGARVGWDRWGVPGGATAAAGRTAPPVAPQAQAAPPVASQAQAAPPASPHAGAGQPTAPQAQAAPPASPHAGAGQPTAPQARTSRSATSPAPGRADAEEEEPGSSPTSSSRAEPPASSPPPPRPAQVIVFDELDDEESPRPEDAPGTPPSPPDEG